jgi:hypothetical protein
LDGTERTYKLIVWNRVGLGLGIGMYQSEVDSVDADPTWAEHVAYFRLHRLERSKLCSTINDQMLKCSLWTAQGNTRPPKQTMESLSRWAVGSIDSKTAIPRFSGTEMSRTAKI